MHLRCRRDATGVTFGGTGQPMEVSEARQKGLCFKCGMKGHIAKFCPNCNKVEVRQMIVGMTPEMRKLWMDELKDVRGTRIRVFTDRGPTVGPRSYGPYRRSATSWSISPSISHFRIFHICSYFISPPHISYSTGTIQ